MNMVLRRTFIFGAASILLVIAAGCGGGSESAIPAGPISARVIVTNVQISADDQRVESITVLKDDGEEITMILGEAIDPEAWDPGHLLTHAGLGETLGFKIGVTYVRTGDSVVATQLSE